MIRDQHPTCLAPQHAGTSRTLETRLTAWVSSPGALRCRRSTTRAAATVSLCRPWTRPTQPANAVASRPFWRTAAGTMDDQDDPFAAMEAMLASRDSETEGARVRFRWARGCAP